MKENRESEKPAPAFGQRWKWNDKRSKSAFVLEPDGTYGQFAGAYEDGGRTGWFGASYLLAHATFLGPESDCPTDAAREATVNRGEGYREFGYARVGNSTALEAIQARKKPEPWRPSVDDWDLLPDAGTSYTGRLP